MRILIVAPSQDAVSGNWVTAHRFQHGLEQRGYRVTLHGTPLQPQGALRRQVQTCSPDVVLLLHAYRSGRPWLEEGADLDIPWVVLLTGTDVNLGLNAPGESEWISSVLQQSACVLVQNPLIAADLSVSYPGLSAKLRILPAGIVLGKDPYDLRSCHDLPLEQEVFLCPAGVRPVKGLVELLEMSEGVAAASPTFVLAFCGPLLDESYSRRLLAAVAERPWARYLGTIPAPAMASAMRGADIIVNNSRSEGLANTLLEAAALGIPILARRIPGNIVVVRHNLNGLLYRDAAEFQDMAIQLLDRPKRRQLVCPKPELYPPGQEAEVLAGILHQATSSWSATAGHPVGVL